ncbi:hypothetical protein [Spiroplasma endosymbiont of Monopis laevigella]|uniref:hypothetical protein n=1 Tax=Spiroplasma endosymbiont of Monopis laevigella TaxID=3066312 RepID=UPI0030D1628C
MKTLIKTLSVLTLPTTTGNLTNVLNTIEEKTNIATNYIQNKKSLENKHSVINLADIIVNNNLGLINSGKDLAPSKMSLLIGIIEANHAIKSLTINDFDIKRQDNSTATIIGKGDYIGTVNLYYSITNFVSKKLTNGNIYALGVDSQGNIFRAQEDKVYKITPTGLEILMAGLEGYWAVRALVIDNEDNVYVGSDNGFVYKSDGVRSFEKIIIPGPKNWIWALTFDKNTETVYVGSNTGVCKISKNGSTSLMQGTNGDHIHSLAVGSDGSIYAGDDDRGIIYKTDKISQTFGIFQQINDGHQIDSLVVDKDNTVFAGSWNGRLYKIKNGIYEVILETNPNHEVKGLVIDRDNNLFVGIDSNKVYKKIEDTDLCSELSGIKNTDDHIFALAVGPDDSIYAAGSQGILYTAKNFNKI